LKSRKKIERSDPDSLCKRWKSLAQYLEELERVSKELSERRIKFRLTGTIRTPAVRQLSERRQQ